MRFMQIVESLTQMQKKIIWAGIACLGLLVLFPPWTPTFHTSAGYHFIFAAPNDYAHIDFPRAILPMLFVIVATIVAVLLTTEKRQKQG